jgi:hypothetical protein
MHEPYDEREPVRASVALERPGHCVLVDDEQGVLDLVAVRLLALSGCQKALGKRRAGVARSGQGRRVVAAARHRRIANWCSCRTSMHDLARFLETDPDAKRQLLGLLFEKIWLDERRVVAVQPKPAFAPFFQHRHRKPLEKGCVKSGSDRGQTPT